MGWGLELCGLVGFVDLAGCGGLVWLRSGL